MQPNSNAAIAEADKEVLAQYKMSEKLFQEIVIEKCHLSKFPKQKNTLFHLQLTVEILQLLCSHSSFNVIEFI